MFGILFGLVGLVFSLAFGLVSGTTKVALGTTKVAVGTTAAATELTLGLLLRNVVRIAALSLVGYLVYELVTGYAQGKVGAPAPAAAPRLPAPPAPAPSPAARPAASTPSPIVGGSDHAGKPVQVVDAGGVAHQARVGRGVIRR